MSLFGSREEDPLLQDDPFAPSSQENQPADDAENLDGLDKTEDPDNSDIGGSVFENSEEWRVVRSSQGQFDEINTLLKQGWFLHNIELHNTPPSSTSHSFVFVLRRPDPSE